jgi:hypothetical protein
MSSVEGSELRIDGDGLGADASYRDAERRALAGWSPLRARSGTPPSMAEELTHLQAAFPAFSFGIGRGWCGLTFEAWCDPQVPGLYALITQDAGELWRELEACRQSAADVAPAAERR